MFASAQIRDAVATLNRDNHEDAHSSREFDGSRICEEAVGQSVVVRIYWMLITY